MFPFENRRQWVLFGRYHHLIEATEGHLDRFPEPYRSTAARRARVMRRWLKVRLVLIGLLSPSILATLLGLVARALGSIRERPFLQETLDLLDWVVSVASAVAILIGLAFLLVNRYVGQMEADLIACLALGSVAAEPAKRTKTQ